MFGTLKSVRRLSVYFVTMVLVGLLFIFTNTPAHTKSNGSMEFVKKVRAFAEQLNQQTKSRSKAFRKNRWLSQSSPWAPYLKRQFTDGLTASDRRQHEALIKQNKCAEADKLERKGFLSLYNNLGASFQTPYIQNLFASVVVPYHSRADQRCRAIRFLAPLIAISRELDSPIYYASAVATAGLHKTARPVATGARVILDSIYAMESLGLCHHDKAALQYIADNAKPLLYLEMARIRGFYLLHLSEKLGVDISGLAAHLESHLPGVSPVDVARIQRTFSQLPAEQASRRLWYRKNTCQVPMRLLP